MVLQLVHSMLYESGVAVRVKGDPFTLDQL